MRVKGGYAYIITNQSNKVLYTGVTSNLKGRTWKHKVKFYKKSFSARYNVNKLVYYEWCETIMLAIAREKQLKAGSRKKKIMLIESMNKNWEDLYDKIINEV
jgi:putative endonuclease